MVCQFDNHINNSTIIRISSLVSDWISSKSFALIFSLLFMVLFLGAARMQSFAQSYTYEVNTIPLKGELIDFAGLSILQDSDGFMWFGSEDGLYRYHGSGLRKFRNEPHNPNSLYEDRVFELFEDSEGDIWVGTDGGLYGFDKFSETFRKYQEASYEIHDFVEDKNGYIWFSTIGGIVRFDKTSGSTKQYLIHWEQSTPFEIPYYVNDLYIDQENCLWICGNDELLRFDIESESFERIADAFQASGFLEDMSGWIWIASTKGLYSFDREDKTLRRHLNDPGNDNNLHDQHIRAMIEDISGNIWIRTYDGIYCYDQNLELKYHGEHARKYTHTHSFRFLSRPLIEDNTGAIWYYSPDGIHQITKEPAKFTTYGYDPELQKIITCVLVENDALIWFGTYDGLFCLDRERNTVTKHFGGSPNGSNPYAISSIFEDRNGTFWLGTSYHGLLSMSRSGESEFQFERHLPDLTGSTGRYDSNLMYPTHHIFEDSQGRLWIGRDYGPICYFDRKENKFIRLVDNPSSEDKLPGSERIQIRHETASNILWATGGDGVYKLLPPFLTAAEDEIMASQVIKCQAFPSISSYMDSVGTIWLGTENSGLARLTENGIKFYTTDHGLPSNKVVSIIDDGKGNLWLGTVNGLSKFNLQSETFTNYYERHGLSNNIFSKEAVAAGMNGEVFFGTWNGIFSFNPDDIQLNQYVAPVRITDFKIQNLSILPGEQSVLQKSIIYTDKMELKHNQDHLSFEFAILNYQDHELNQYKYMLEGLDPDWIYSGSRNFAAYSNLKPGRYTFRATGSNNDGIWNEEGTSLDIIIRPPPWLKWWAYIIYGFIILSIILLYRQYLLNRAKLRTDVEIERIEKEKVQEIDHMRSRFFANVSHEFRTPLTLLLGPIEDLKKNLPGLSIENRSLLQTMRNNVRRLQNLVNQLLDISKLETGSIKIQVSEGNLTEFIRTIVLSFLSLAESKKIRYEYDLQEITGPVYFDGDKLEKILTNMVSNAFKFTPKEGRIDVILEFIITADNGSPSFAEISVKDTGKGIPEDKLENVFDRFYQVSDSDTREHEGTGIGLALTREMVDLYRGKISVESEIGKGSTFIVRLPVSKELFEEHEIVPAPAPEKTGPGEEIVESAETEKTDIPEAQTVVKDEDTPRILIVEDHTELRNYITRNLDDEYHILEAENGREGLHKAIEGIPDLVITDLMMPEMDGMELCEKLKKDDRTSHIPVIMLTARADRDSKLKGLETGADDYIIKPFDAEELLVRTNNLIKQRRILREKFLVELRVKSLEDSVGVPGDKLLHRVLDIFRQNIGNPKFNVDSLSDELNISRSQVFRKIGALTGIGPSELLRIVRLKRAAELILTKKLNITQVMYEVGFQTPAYFARQFREYFGVNPSEYKRHVNN